METNDMSTPHKATESQWGTVRRRAEVDWNNDSTDSVLVEIADRVAALEAAATQPPAPAANHFRGATEMVATDEKLIETFHVGARGVESNSGFRAIYNLGRQHSAQPRQEEQPLPAPAAVAPLLWVLWHHLGASSQVGQPIRRYLGMGQHDRMTSEEVEAAQRWARESMGVQDYLEGISVYGSATPQPTPPPATAGENVVAMVIDVIHFITGEHVADSLACGVIHAVANWLQQRSDTIANGSQWAEMLRGEAER
jgi:hypothetical protein